MARRRRNRKTHSRNLRFSGQRNILKSPIANPRLLNRTLVRTVEQVLLDAARLSGQDYRAYNPRPKTLRPARTVSGRIAFVNIQKRAPLRKARFVFEDPKRVTVCVRRKMRREVLHAFKKTGKGSGRNRRRRFTADSFVICRS